MPYPDNPAIFFNGFGDAFVSDNGAIVFWASIAGPGVHYSDNNDGIWYRNAQGEISLIAREGDTPADWTSGEKMEFLFGPSPSINNRGQVMFTADFRRPGADPYIGTAILATDTAGQLQTIVRTGDVIDIDNGQGIDLRTIAGLGTYRSFGNNGGEAGTFSDSGEVMFQALFMDGTVGVFTSTLVAVPEPSCLMPIVFAAAFAMWRGRSS